MNFIVILLNLIGLILYLAAGGCIIMMIAGILEISDGDKAGAKISLIGLIGGFMLIFGGYWTREGAENIKHNDAFANSFKNRDAHNVVWQFRSLSNNKKEKYIAEIYKRFYNDSISGQIRFVNDFGNEDISFVIQKKKKLNYQIEQMYNDAERMNTTIAWLNFSKEIPGQFFLNQVDTSLKVKEFNKWESDERAWERVLLMDSVVMSREYLKKYPEGKYVIDAKRIILNHAYESNKDDHSYHKIKNYTGTTTLYIHNSSNSEINVRYGGSFADGNMKISAYSSSSRQIPNGYYHVSITSNKLHTKGDYWSATFDGGTISRDYMLVQDYRR